MKQQAIPMSVLAAAAAIPANTAKAKAADVVVPLKPPPRDIAFPGGTVGSTDDGQLTITIDSRTDRRTLAGSDHKAFTETLLGAVLATIHITSNPADTVKHVAAAAAALAAFKPADEVEAMLAAQAVAMHHMAMECFRRGALGDQHPDIASKLRKDGANLCRGMVEMLDGLDRRRGKVSQVVRVERVVVHEGGQAIVGNVQPAAALPAGGAGG